MRKILQAVAFGAALYAACCNPSLGADYAEFAKASPEALEQKSDWVRAGGDCGRRLCALDTSIFSLYGSYGPEGGPTYWGAYSRAGWGAER
jgi:hypothetical protein